MNVVYIDIDQAIETHRLTVQVSGGGLLSVIDSDKLESVLTHIQNDDYYPSFVDKLTHLVFSANKFHCFSDGNKRIAISLGAQFLLLNGYVFIARRFIQEMENISYHVAAGKIDKDFLKEIITSIIYEPDYPEDLKLKIYDAIKDDINS
jgi:death on curing protein